MFSPGQRKARDNKTISGQKPLKANRTNKAKEAMQNQGIPEVEWDSVARLTNVQSKSSTQCQTREFSKPN